MTIRSRLAALAFLSFGLVGCPGSTIPVDGGPGVDAPATVDAPTTTDAPAAADVPATDAPNDAGCPSPGCAPPPANCVYAPSTDPCTCPPLVCGAERCDPACGAGEFCDLCGAAPDCAPVPIDEGRVCTREYRPVCGCDGNTYENRCYLDSAGIALLADGECAETCGGVVCGEGQFCDTGPSCGSNDGTCRARPTSCPDIFRPVCGCDGTTYSNACDAAASGVGVASEGMCMGCSPPCGPGQTCQLCRGPGGPVYACIPDGAAC